MRRNDFQLHSFLGYLTDSGAEIGVPTSQYEVVRYRYWSPSEKRAAISIVYTKENGRLTFTGNSRQHYHSFMQGRSIDLKTKKANSKPANKSKDVRKHLLERDGPDCWFCGEVMGDDCTIEHLVPKSRGGRNSQANYALAHASCNQKAANIPLVKKMELREKMRRSKVKS